MCTKQELLGKSLPESDLPASDWTIKNTSKHEQLTPQHSHLEKWLVLDSFSPHNSYGIFTYKTKVYVLDVLLY